MIKKKLLKPKRVRKIEGSFSFLEHRFMQQGFFENLTQHELLLYLFLVLASDHQGISYYSYDRICSITGITLDEYIYARNGLINTDLLAFDGFFFQVLALPTHAIIRKQPLTPEETNRGGDPVHVSDLLRRFLQGRTFNMANNSNLNQAINDYLLWLIDTGYAESTIYHYERKLIHFQNYIGSGTDSLDAILSYKKITAYKRDSTLTDCTVSVWGLARYLYENKRLTELPSRKPKDLPILYETYLSDSQTNGSISGRRIAGCRKTLMLLSGWLTRKGRKLQQLRIEHVDRFLSEISKNYEPETMQSRRSFLRGFLNWLYQNAITKRNLALLVVGPPQYAATKPPRFLRADEIKKLFMVIPATQSEQRTLAMLNLACYLGLRPVEISRISLDDILFSKQEILLPTRKNCNPIAVPLPMTAIKAIADYVINVRPQSESRKLFIGLHAPYKPVKSTSVCSTITTWMHKAGVPGSAYWLRHTYAQNLLEADASIFEIKEMLGHDRIQTTSRYLKIHITMMRKVLFNEAI